MTSAIINSLPEADWLLIREAEPSALADLGEDDLLELRAASARRAQNASPTTAAGAVSGCPTSADAVSRTRRTPRPATVLWSRRQAKKDSHNS